MMNGKGIRDHCQQIDADDLQPAEINHKKPSELIFDLPGAAQVRKAFFGDYF